MDLWYELSPGMQDAAICAALLLLPLGIGWIILRGFSPLPLLISMLFRFRGTVFIFCALIAISVGIGISLIAQEKAIRQASAQAAEKFDLVVSAPGSEITMLLASVFLQPSSVSLLDGAAFDAIANRPGVAMAAPLAFGDSVDGIPVVGTTADFLRYLSDDRIEGSVWADHREAVIGADLPYNLGDKMVPEHGIGGFAEQLAHEAEEFVVVGRLPRSGTPWDRAIVVSIETVWQVHGLASGHAPERYAQVGPPFDPDYFPGTPAVIVRPESIAAAYGLQSAFNSDPRTMAFFPGSVLARLHSIMGDIRQAISIVTLISQGLLALSVLLGTFILLRLIRRQMAVLRALGAPDRFIFALLWSFAMSLLVAGAVAGIGVGYASTAWISDLVTARTGMAVTARIGWSEMLLLAAFVSLASLCALLPAIAFVRQPIVVALRS